MIERKPQGHLQCSCTFFLNFSLGGCGVLLIQLAYKLVTPISFFLFQMYCYINLSFFKMYCYINLLLYFPTLYVIIAFMMIIKRLASITQGTHISSLFTISDQPQSATPFFILIFSIPFLLTTQPRHRQKKQHNQPIIFQSQSKIQPIKGI